MQLWNWGWLLNQLWNWILSLLGATRISIFTLSASIGDGWFVRLPLFWLFGMIQLWNWGCLLNQFIHFLTSIGGKGKMSSSVSWLDKGCWAASTTPQKSLLNTKNNGEIRQNSNQGGPNRKKHDSFRGRCDSLRYYLITYSHIPYAYIWL